jgi:hypothetical protein
MKCLPQARYRCSTPRLERFAPTVPHRCRILLQRSSSAACGSESSRAGPLRPARGRAPVRVLRGVGAARRLCSRRGSPTGPLLLLLMLLLLRSRALAWGPNGRRVEREDRRRSGWRRRGSRHAAGMKGALQNRRKHVRGGAALQQQIPRDQSPAERCPGAHAPERGRGGSSRADRARCPRRAEQVKTPAAAATARAGAAAERSCSGRCSSDLCCGPQAQKRLRRRGPLKPRGSGREARIEQLAERPWRRFSSSWRRKRCGGGNRSSGSGRHVSVHDNCSAGAHIGCGDGNWAGNSGRWGHSADVRPARPADMRWFVSSASSSSAASGCTGAAALSGRSQRVLLPRILRQRERARRPHLSFTPLWEATISGELLRGRGGELRPGRVGRRPAACGGRASALRLPSGLRLDFSFTRRYLKSRRLRPIPPQLNALHHPHVLERLDYIRFCCTQRQTAQEHLPFGHCRAAPVTPVHNPRPPCAAGAGAELSTAISR